ncbi:putative heparan-alpha-glucosaminide N-acetyltransferase [Medicago truncatula]|uniref:Putative heparan-alpha-glucosaminide N-acetyltransferase n=1 Tax=Medicago truncatula TaxID=3880 RepID=A0A396GUZ2_MEDTR|nr:heparan-alpha-glucosaminide N-acetyltransferase [Medicago truncatula]XP_024627351.1 heparan-alpha-glucosaminide N-acetyltransferase [Medicago truncatula]RHN44021.1 putative heparan-alpha-glucosaminide N-acetyltransferase [Medicago truncatula]
MKKYEAIKSFEENDEDLEMGHENQIHDSATKIINNEERSTMISSSSSSSRKQEQQQHQQQPQTSQRLLSLDVFRGLTVALMILVDDAGGLIPALNHSPWNGLTIADFVMPFFLFIVGVALAFTYKKPSCKVDASRKAVLRALKLLALGIFLQGGYVHRVSDLTFGVDLKQIRLMGILQRIAVAYLITALCEIWLKREDIVNSGSSLLRKYRYQWALALFLSVIYLCLLYGMYVPDWEYEVPTEPSSEPMKFSVKCGVRGDTGPACNVVGMIDRSLLGLQHLYRRPIYARMPECSINSPDYGPLPPDAPSWCQAPFDPEGLLSSVMAIVTCLVGLHYGHIILHFKNHRIRILHWMIPTSCLVVSGIALDLFGMHVNKVLYSFSYTCLTAGAAGILFAGIYLMVDVCGYSRMTSIFQWIGMHALMIYVLAACNIFPIFLQGFYWGNPHNNILKLIGVGS